MIDRSEAGARSGFFGLWDLLALSEEVSTWALLGHAIDRDAIRLRLGVFPGEDLPLARNTLQVLILITTEIRAVLEDAGSLDQAPSVRWPPAPLQLEEEAERLIDAAENLSFLPESGYGEPDGPNQAHHAVRRVLGFVSGSIALSDAQMDLNVTWLSEALATLGPQERRRLQNAADVVFWAAAVLLAVLGDGTTDEQRSGGTRSDDPSGAPDA